MLDMLDVGCIPARAGAARARAEILLLVVSNRRLPTATVCVWQGLAVYRVHACRLDTRSPSVGTGSCGDQSRGKA